MIKILNTLLLLTMFFQTKPLHFEVIYLYQEKINEEYLKVYKKNTHFDFDYNIATMEAKGHCDDINQVIFINQKLFKEALKAYSISLEKTIRHELGHCVLKREHDFSMISKEPFNVYPKSLMYPLEISTLTYLENKAYYDLELLEK